MPTRKIIETVRASALKRVDGKLVSSVTYDTDIKGFAFVVTTRRAFWCLVFRPKGVNPATGRRWGGGVRHELGDAFATSIADARAAALKAKALVRQGHDPHRQAMAFRTSAVAQRGVMPTTFSQALDAYEKAVMARREPSETTRRRMIHYARKAVRLLNAEALEPSRLGSSMIRLMVETADGSAGERRHVFGALSRFLSWCRRQGLVEHNPCDALDRGERPKPGKARDHTPSLKLLRAVWTAAEGEPQRDLVRFLELVPLRRGEAASLLWREVNFDKGRILIGANRTKNGEVHELPLAPQALAILKNRWRAGGDACAAKRHEATVQRLADERDASALVFPSAALKPFDGWGRLATRIRARTGQADAPKARAFTFHDIRRSFVSHLAERGFDVDLLDQCLGHTRKGVLGVYQRASRMAERSAAVNTWASLLLEESTAHNPVKLHAGRLSDELAGRAGHPRDRSRVVGSLRSAPAPLPQSAGENRPT
jgi:integrase